MAISKDNSNKLFHKPVVKRDEPEVTLELPLKDLPYSEPESNKDYEDFTQRLKALTDAYVLVVNDLNKLLNVLIRRAEMDKISLPLAELCRQDSNLSNAVQTVYNQQPDSLSFGQFTNLLRLEKSIISKETSSVVSLTEDIKTSLSSISNPVLRAIGVIKDSFHKHLIDQGAEYLLLADTIVDSIAKNQSSQSALNFMPEGYVLDEDLLNDTSDEAGKKKKNNKNKLSKLVEECIPCGDRFYGLWESFRLSKPIDLFIQLYTENLLGELDKLLKLKLAIANPQLMNSLCSMINYISDYMCLPDIVAILSLFKLQLGRLKAMFKEITLNAALPGEYINAFIKPALDALFTMVARLLSTAFSPIYCLMDSIQVQADKAGLDAGFDQNEIKSRERELHQMLVQSMQSLESWVSGVLKEIEAMLSLSVGRTNDITAILAQMDKYMQWIGLLGEIYSFYQNLHKSYPVKLNKLQMKDLLNKSAKAICVASYANKSWLSLFDNLEDDLTGTGGDDDSGDDQNGDDGNNTGGDGDDGGDDDKDVIIITDESLGDDFYDDDALDLLDDQEWKDKFNNSLPDATLSQGESNLRPDEDDLNRYKLLKQRMLLAKKTLKNTDQDTTAGIPSIIINFQSCIDKFNLSGDPVLVNEWISRIVNG